MTAPKNNLENERLKEIRELNNRLTALLDDPHPGLASWAIAYGRVMKEIVAFWEV